jgi:hypothetical protein
MACPMCNCKVTYPFQSDPDLPKIDEGMERCSWCGYIFYVDDAADENDYIPLPPSRNKWS